MRNLPTTNTKVQIDVSIMKKLIEEMERGKKSTHLMRNIILKKYSREKCNDFYDQDYYNELDNHSIMALDTYVRSLSMLKSYDFEGVLRANNKRSHQHEYESFDDNGGREGYKRRKHVEFREEEVTHLTDDGFGWRKYGQKMILKSPHPRHYYRCTHKEEQKCQATKQVQQISKNPTKYKIIYHNNHTCNNNIHKATPFTIHSSNEEQSSAFVVSFDGSNPVNNPFLFPTSSALYSSPTTTMYQNSPSSEDASISSDGTSMVNELSEEVFVAENDYSSSVVTFDGNLDDDCSFIMTDFSQLLPDWWTS